MSGQAVNELVTELVRTPPGKPGQLEAALAARFQLTEENERWSFYQIEFPEGPFVRGDYRVSRVGERALLSLTPRDPKSLRESELDLTPWGEVQNIDVNPRIPPEGTDTLVFEVEGVRIGFQFTHHSRRLRTLSVRWGPVD